MKFQRRMSKFTSYRKGMSLVELIIVIALIGVISAIVGRTLSSGLASYRVSQQTINLQEKAARVMREFEFSARAATVIVTANSNELAFYRYYNLTSASPTLVRYFVDGKQFKVGKTLPIGLPPNVLYPAETENIDFLVDDLTETNSIFTYYDDSGSVLIGPVTIPAIRMVGLNISLDKDISMPPLPISESTKVNLRNMKNNL